MPEINEDSKKYTVLARKYRPGNFDDLIGQEALVTTLTNAIEKNRIAHAYILTGIRGVGKTTTARIIAKGLNCIGTDGKGGPTSHPCGECENCKAISEDRHVDVFEMDAASRTGVNDIREILDGVRYRPTSARYKIYIIDEVHMLSKSAFNALLKTLEEPPEHVKFIFATTEIRKVPVTVLSRCQRFDLRRIEVAELEAHFKKICDKENVTVEQEALTLVARCADGSVRDGLSLLDQAIARSSGSVSADEVRSMVGLADRAIVFDLFESLMKGDIATVLEFLKNQYNCGADPIVILQDLLELSHWLTKVKILPEASNDVSLPEAERTKGKQLAETLSMAVLTRAWQMLLKGINEAKSSSASLAAVEMVLIRLAYASSLPTPAEVVEDLKKNSNSLETSPIILPKAPVMVEKAPEKPAEIKYDNVKPVEVSIPKPVALEEKKSAIKFASFEDLTKLLMDKKQAGLAFSFMNDIYPVSLEKDKMTIALGNRTPRDFVAKLGHFLEEESGAKWIVDVVHHADGMQTLQEKAKAIDDKNKQDLSTHPLVKGVLDTFKGSYIDKLTRKISEVETNDEPIMITETGEQDV